MSSAWVRGLASECVKGAGRAESKCVERKLSAAVKLAKREAWSAYADGGAGVMSSVDEDTLR